MALWGSQDDLAKKDRYTGAEIEMDAWTDKNCKAYWFAQDTLCNAKMTLIGSC